MRRITLLFGSALVLLSAANCADAPSAVLPAAPFRSTGTIQIELDWVHRSDSFPGQVCTWYVTYVGGTPPLTYTWTTENLEEFYAGEDSWRGSAISPGSYSLTLQVTDALGKTGSKTVYGTSSYDSWDPGCS